MSYQEQQKKVHAENEERERRKVEDELEQQNEEARKTLQFDDFYSLQSPSGLANALFFENGNQRNSYSSLSIEYNPNRKKKQSFQTSRITSHCDRSSLVISNPTFSDQTAIPFFDEHQGDSMLEEKRSHPVLSRQRTRNYSYVSERNKHDNESTVTVKSPFSSRSSWTKSRRAFSCTRRNLTSNTRRSPNVYHRPNRNCTAFDRRVSVDLRVQPFGLRSMIFISLPFSMIRTYDFISHSMLHDFRPLFFFFFFVDVSPRNSA